MSSLRIATRCPWVPLGVLFVFDLIAIQGLGNLEPLGRDVKKNKMKAIAVPQAQILTSGSSGVNSVV
jgi:hypothetical protein